MRTLRAKGLAALVAAACTSLALVAPAASAAAPHAPSAASHREIVFLRATGGSLSESRTAQASVAAAATRLGATVLARTLVPTTLTVRATGSQVRRLRAIRTVSMVLRDATIVGAGTSTAPAVPTTARQASSVHGAAAHPSCGTAAHPQLNPEALANIDAPGAWSHGATGRGVKVAFLADGLDTTNPDLQRSAAYASAGSAAGTPVIADYQDFSSDGAAATTGGAEAFGDAASIAAQGNATYDLSSIVGTAHPLPKHCDIRIIGSAPGASLLALKIFATNNSTTGSAFVQAISYAVAHGANVINESFGANPTADTAGDIIKAANAAAIAAGVLVVASTGDAGINNSIGSPASEPGVLAVGATTTFRAYQQSTYGGINAPGSTGAYLDNNISSLSSGGITQGGKTLDLVAPGDLGWSLCSASATYQECSGQHVQDFGGTSQAAPLTSGAAADVIQAYAVTHHGSRPSPALVARILTSSSRDVRAPAAQQGAGLLDVAAAVSLARSIKGTTAAPQPGLLASITQADLKGTPSQTVGTAFSLVNTGRTAEVVTLGARALRAAGAVAGHVTLDPSVGTSQPKFAIWSGAEEVYQRASFTVPKGVDRVQLASAFTFTNQTSVLHVALFDPHGTFAGYSLPQGDGGFADVEVATPVPGKWSAVFFTVWNGWMSGNVGTKGTVPWTATFWRYHAVGKVTPSSVTLPGGRAVSVKLRVALPNTPGDSSLAVTVVAGPSATVARLDTTIPVTLRAVVPLGAKGGAFHGVLTGGNGRGGAPGQMNTFDFTVPANKTDLDASVAMASNPAGGLLPGTQVVGALIDPAGQLAAYDSNFTASPSAPFVVSRYLNLFKANPAPGLWRLVLQWEQPIAGTKVAIGFNGAVRFNEVSVLSTLPNSSVATVSKSSGADFEVQVNNTGLSPMWVSPDPRTTGYQVIPIPDTFSTTLTQSVPNAANTFFVPTETKAVNVQVAGSVPMTFDMNSLTGDPDVSPSVAMPAVSGSVTPSLATLTYGPSTGVTPGLWGTFPAEIGPYGAGAAPTATETTTFTAQTLGFDAAVTSAVPDSVEGLALGTTINPDYVLPGTSDIIAVHVAPTASVGAVVTGTLFITALTPGSIFGETIAFTSLYTDELAAIPYQYKVGA